MRTGPFITPPRLVVGFGLKGSPYSHWRDSPLFGSPRSTLRPATELLRATGGLGASHFVTSAIVCKAYEAVK